MTMPQFEVVAKVGCRVGESPVWDAGNQTLLWCDSRAGTIFELDTRTNQLSRHGLPNAVGSFGLTDNGGLIIAMASGIHLYARDSKMLSLLVDPEPGHADRFPGDRLNDSKVGPDGAFWVGSMHKSGPTAALYRVTSDGRAEKKVDGLETSNGLAFSADGRWMFHTDSKQGWIERYDLDPLTGALSNRSRIAELSDVEGRPDGAATDAAGYYWSAGVSAGRLNKFRADGKLEARIELPLKRPTMVCFGGTDMRTLFITSIRRPDDASDLCGDVLSLRVDVPGVPVPAFKTAMAGER